MGESEVQRWFLFGGLGFIGQHLAARILSRPETDSVVLLDIRDPEMAGWQDVLKPYVENARLEFVQCDVRKPIDLVKQPRPGDILVNLAAVHREPGHKPAEYFETNIKGAENICALAERCGCEEIIFTSSISVYGEFEQTVDEDSPPQPKTAYGQSKLKAEESHQAWAKRTGGRLMIIRPGVVFGPGEGGNVSRLVKECIRRGQSIQLEPDLAKAGIYIEELLDMIFWLHGLGKKSLLVNGVSRDLLHFNDYGKALQSLQRFRKPPLVIPIRTLAAVLKLASPFGVLMPASARLHPQRLLKLTRPNAIRSSRLRRMGYPYSWRLDRALADWLSRGI